MPNASASRDTERIELKSCPGAFVELRTMTFGEWQKRQDIVMSVQLEMAGRGRQNMASLTMNNQDLAKFEFEHCIIDHNLEDATGRKYNFSNPKDLADLHPKVGNELGELINKRHEWQEDEQENFSAKQNS
jgi:hypothetical protein